MFRAPILIGIASLVALVIGLFGEGPEDVVAWLGLSAPLIVAAWALVARRA